MLLDLALIILNLSGSMLGNIALIILNLSGILERMMDDTNCL